MHKFDVLSTAVASVLLSSAALAAMESDIGVIKSVDAAKHQIVLDTGKAYEAPTVDLSTFKVGQKVNVSFDTKDGKMVAAKVEITK